MRKTVHLALCLILILTSIALMGVSAAAAVNLDKSGSVSVHIHTQNGINVQDARIGLYLVGKPEIVNHNLHFSPTGSFEECNVSLNNLSDTGIAAELAAWAKANRIASNMQTHTDSEGKASFEAVSPGLYLVIQSGFKDGKTGRFSEIQPFIVTVPMSSEAGTSWIYEIEAQPKVNPIITPSPTVKPTTPPSDASLPQTGMLRWPVPVWGVGGIVLFSIGWALFFGKKKADRDA